MKGFVVRLVVANRVVEVDVFLAVRSVVFLGPAPGVLAADGVLGQFRRTFGATGVFGDIAPAAVLVPTLAEQNRAVLVKVLDDVMVEDFAVVLAFAGLAAAIAAGTNGEAVLHPVGHVQIMDVLLANVVAAHPDEIV